MARRRHRSPANQFPVFDNDTTLGWKVIKRTSFAHAEERVKVGTARRVNDEIGKHIGYQFAVSSTESSSRALPMINPSMCSISAVESELNAGVFFQRGGSRTADMSEEQRKARIHPKSGKLLPEEDDVELAVAKIAAWTQPAPGRGDRAVRVYPKG